MRCDGVSVRLYSVPVSAEPNANPGGARAHRAAASKHQSPGQSVEHNDAINGSWFGRGAGPGG